MRRNSGSSPSQFRTARRRLSVPHRPPVGLPRDRREVAEHSQRRAPIRQVEVEHGPALRKRPDGAAIGLEPHALQVPCTSAMKDLEKLRLGSGGHRSCGLLPGFRGRVNGHHTRTKATPQGRVRDDPRPGSDPRRPSTSRMGNRWRYDMWSTSRKELAIVYLLHGCPYRSILIVWHRYSVFGSFGSLS